MKFSKVRPTLDLSEDAHWLRLFNIPPDSKHFGPPNLRHLLYLAKSFITLSTLHTLVGEKERNEDPAMARAVAAPCISAFFFSFLCFSAFAISNSALELNNKFLRKKILKDEAVERIELLGKVSDSTDWLERTFLSPASLKAARLIKEWMQDAGLETWIDDIGNVHGRSEGANSSSPTLLLGSHFDTVIDGGKYDGALGIISAIAAVKVLHTEGKLKEFPRPIEVIAFSDEEGVRFQSTFLGSSAIAGKFSPDLLYMSDKSGITLQDSLKASSLKGTEESIQSLKYDPASIWGYVEIHIEQGPVLEERNIPVGIVEAIAGQTRLRVTLQGLQGHAGTVPMKMRRDPMPAAAQVVLAVEHICTSSTDLVCTVGEIHAWPGASNVIAGEVMFTLDVRSKNNNLVEQTVNKIRASLNEACRQRKLSCTAKKMHEAKATKCSPELVRHLNTAVQSTLKDLVVPNVVGHSLLEEDLHVPLLTSGAGHDAMALAHLTQVGMLFVRCKAGVSHSPAEYVLDTDVAIAGESLLQFLQMKI